MKYENMAEKRIPAGDSALFSLGSDDRELTSFHFAEHFGPFPVRLLRMIKITSTTNGWSTFAHDGTGTRRAGTETKLTNRDCLKRWTIGISIGF